MNKKGIALMFLVELLLLVAIAIVAIGATASIVTSDTRVYAFDAHNLALLLERAAITSGNFEYLYHFQSNVSISVNDKAVALGRAFSPNRKFIEPNRSPFELELKESVDSLYVVKSGEEFLLLTPEEYTAVSAPMYVVPSNTPESASYLYLDENEQRKLFLREKVQFVTEENIPQRINQGVLWQYVDSEESDVVIIQYNLKAKDAAFDMYNKIGEKYPAALVPINTYPTLQHISLNFNEYPVIITKAKSAEFLTQI